MTIRLPAPRRGHGAPLQTQSGTRPLADDRSVEPRIDPLLSGSTGSRRARRWPALESTTAREVAMVAGLVLLAAALRWPYLWEIPRFTDETEQALLGLRVARGQASPWTGVAAYIGALWNLLLAGGFLISGPSVYTPRVLVWAVGALTVVPTYLLARSFGGRTVGLLAAAMLALSPVHIAVLSHIAFSHCIAPLFTTFGFWLLHRAVRTNRPSGLLWSAPAFSLALQAHATIFALLPGVAAYVISARPRWLLSRWLYLAAALAVLVYGNVIFNTLSNNQSALRSAQERTTQYARGETLSPAVYGARLTQVSMLLGDSLSGALSDNHELRGPLEDPGVLAFSLLALAGLALAARRGNLMPLLAVASVLLILPLVNPHYDVLVLKARHVGPLLPLCYGVMALLLVAAYQALGRLRGRVAPLLAGPARAAVGLATLAALAVPLVGLARYYREAEQDGRSNAVLFQAMQGVESVRDPAGTVFLDRELTSASVLGGADLLRRLIFVSEIRGWPYQVVQLPVANTVVVPEVAGPLVLDPGNERLAQQSYRLEPVVVVPAADPIVGVYRSDGPLRGVGRSPPHVQGSLPLRIESVASGLALPAGLAFAPDGRLFFGEVAEGRVRILEAGRLQEAPFVALPITRGWEQGLLGLTLDPSFATNHWVYVFYSEADEKNTPSRNRVVRFTESAGRATEPKTILDDLPINRSRSAGNGGDNGGRLAFGPDGKLYVSVGAAGRPAAAQARGELNGKILRVNPDGSVPADNPFARQPAYAIGFRNVWGLGFHPTTGRLYAADNGPRGYDELDQVLPGRNYGHPAEQTERPARSDLEQPIWHAGPERLGLTGLTFYSGALFPEYRGDLFFCAVNVDGLRRAHLGGPDYDRVEQVELISSNCRLDVTEAPDGALYFSDLDSIHRLAR